MLAAHRNPISRWRMSGGELILPDTRRFSRRLQSLPISVQLRFVRTSFFINPVGIARVDNELRLPDNLQSKGMRTRGK